MNRGFKGKQFGLCLRGNLRPISARDWIGQQWQGKAVNQHGFSGNPFGIDQLMLVKKQLHIFNKSALHDRHRVTVNQMTRFDQYLSPANANPVRALIDEQAVIGAHDQVMRIVQRAGFDTDRRKYTNGVGQMRMT